MVDDWSIDWRIGWVHRNVLDTFQYHINSGQGRFQSYTTHSRAGQHIEYAPYMMLLDMHISRGSKNITYCSLEKRNIIKQKNSILWQEKTRMDLQQQGRQHQMILPPPIFDLHLVQLFPYQPKLHGGHKASPTRPNSNISISLHRGYMQKIKNTES